MNPKTWFRQIWPKHGPEVVRQWSALGQSRLVLADIALRGRVYTPFGREAVDAYTAGRMEGRRELALEILTLANANPDILFALIEKKEPTQ